MSNNTITELDLNELESNEYIKVSKHKSKKMPYHFHIGRTVRNKDGEIIYRKFGGKEMESIDLLEEMDKMKSLERKVILRIKNGIEGFDSIGEVHVKFESNGDRVNFNKGFKALERRTPQLVKRTKRGHYMINPKAFIVNAKYEAACMLWDGVDMGSEIKEDNEQQLKSNSEKLKNNLQSK